MKTIHQSQTAEWSFNAGKSRRDAFNEVELSVRFRHTDGEERLVPAFWAGNKTWRVRFSSPRAGTWHYQTVCSDPSDTGLHGREGEVRVQRYTGSNPLYRHGPIQVGEDRRHFAHADGTPFFWLGDTWWMGLTKRMTWPNGFKALTTNRVAKGFTVVQIVAGLYPDMPWMDKRGANEAGFPWDKRFSRINPGYFDKADRRIEHLVQQGLVPCIVGCWGYFLPWMGMEAMRKHWRNLVARYASYPVVWCLAGEAVMPYYLSTTKDSDRLLQKNGWNEMAVYLRQTDPYHRPTTAHPGSSARVELGADAVSSPEQAAGRRPPVAAPVLDFDMLQTGHGDRSSFPNTVKWVSHSRRMTPPMPVVQGEVCYEGIGAYCGPEVQRWLFWACMLNGAAGFTYGGNGIWQVNTRRKLYGPSPHGMSWGHTPWEDACQLPGSKHLGLAKRFLMRLPWWRIEPHPEWVDPGWTEALERLPFTCGLHDVPLAAGIPGKLRIIYRPMGCGLKKVKGLEKGVRYTFRLFNPVDGTTVKGGDVVPDEHGDWNPQCPGTPAWHPMPVYQDWVLVLEAAAS